MILKRIEEINHSLCVWLERIGIFAMLVMVAVTVIDVTGTKIFKSPVLGSIDIVTLSQVIAIAFTIAIAQITGRHVSVELLVSNLSEKTKVVIDSFIHFLQFLLFALIVWQVIMLGSALQDAGEVSATLYIPLYPFTFALALGFVPMCILCLLKSINSIIKMVTR